MHITTLDIYFSIASEHNLPFIAPINNLYQVRLAGYDRSN